MYSGRLIDLAHKGNGETVKGTVRLASVGVATENGQRCRWIEFDLAADEIDDANGKPMESLKGKGLKEIHKILVPEKFLTEGESPLDHVVRAWRGGAEVPPGEVSRMADPKNAFLLPLLLTGPLEHVKRLPKIDIKSKHGTLSCEGFVGTLDLNAPEGVLHVVTEN